MQEISIAAPSEPAAALFIPHFAFPDFLLLFSFLI
jgi:hypothetical protein